ncbi:MAG TPA: hypothetical protein VF384_15845 [Planctomycetota bacterium]
MKNGDVTMATPVGATVNPGAENSTRLPFAMSTRKSVPVLPFATMSRSSVAIAGFPE